MKLPNCYNSLVDEIQKDYLNYRKAGINRFDAVQNLKHDYANELNDADGCFFVVLGIALTLSRRKELTLQIQKEALDAIALRLEDSEITAKEKQFLLESKAFLMDVSLIGEERTIAVRKKYIPDWQVGDLFAHPLTHPDAKMLGVYEWIILFYKTADYRDTYQEMRQLFLVSICPSEKLPTSVSQLEALGFLRVMEQDNGKWSYLTQMTITNKRYENALGLTKIGHFPGVNLPKDCAVEDPLVTMPLFGYLRKTDAWPSYEKAICRFIKRFGKP